MDDKNKSIDAVVGVMRNKNQEIFITRRQKNQFMSGYWELPGGKVENDESFSNAINRELLEETGVNVESRHLIQTIEHRYPQKTINLSVFSIEKYMGTPEGKEGQEKRHLHAQPAHHQPLRGARVAQFQHPPRQWRADHDKPRQGQERGKDR